MWRNSLSLVAAGLLLIAGRTASAGEVDPATLYDISTAGSSEKVKAGEKGQLVIAIKAKAGAHVSDEAPLKIEVNGTKVKVDKTKLVLADSVAKKAPGQQYADPRFEVPFTGESAGAGRVEAKATFFICTETICARQQRSLTVPVEVN